MYLIDKLSLLNNRKSNIQDEARVRLLGLSKPFIKLELVGMV